MSSITKQYIGLSTHVYMYVHVCERVCVCGRVQRKTGEQLGKGKAQLAQLFWDLETSNTSKLWKTLYDNLLEQEKERKFSGVSCSKYRITVIVMDNFSIGDPFNKSSLRVILEPLHLCIRRDTSWSLSLTGTA